MTTHGEQFESEPGGLIETLAEEYLQRLRAGEAPSLEDYCQRMPDHAKEIRDLFPAMAAMERLKVPPAPTTDISHLDQVGNFQLVGEIGRGGMGVVYEAIEPTLNRRVAIKLLPPAFAQNANLAARFRREASAAARLHHTNIVPVFQVGQDGDQLFYVMQLIRGQGLDRVVTELLQFRDQDRTILGQPGLGSTEADGEPDPDPTATDQQLANPGTGKTLVPGSLTAMLATGQLAHHVGDPTTDSPSDSISSASLPGDTQLSHHASAPPEPTFVPSRRLAFK